MVHDFPVCRTLGTEWLGELVQLSDIVSQLLQIKASYFATPTLLYQTRH